MAQVKMNDESVRLNTTLDTVTIIKCLEQIVGGRVLDTKDFKPEVIHAGHIIIRDQQNGKEYKPMPVNSDGTAYESLPSNHDVVGVAYCTILKSKPNAYSLLRKYSTLEPYTEVTDIMGIVAPIIEGADSIYVLDISEAKEVDTNAESSDGDDTKVTIAGQAYTKSEVIKALKAIIGGNIPANIGDDKLIAKINELSDDDEAKLMQAISSHKA